MSELTSAQIIGNFSYVFFWQGDMHIGVPLPHERSELVVHAPSIIDVEISETIVEEGRAVIPVRLHNKTGKLGNHEIKFEFEG